MPPNRKRGRPSRYTPAIANEICARLAAGESLRAICRDEHMPTETAVRMWALDDREGFFSQYARAREIQAERWADEIIDIADDVSGDRKEVAGANGEAIEAVDHEHIQRSRLRVDTRKWLLSKMLPKKYGDRLAVTDADGGSIAARLAQMSADQRAIWAAELAVRARRLLEAPTIDHDED